MVAERGEEGEGRGERGQGGEVLRERGEREALRGARQEERRGEEAAGGGDLALGDERGDGVELGRGEGGGWRFRFAEAPKEMVEATSRGRGGASRGSSGASGGRGDASGSSDSRDPPLDPERAPP